MEIIAGFLASWYGLVEVTAHPQSHTAPTELGTDVLLVQPSELHI